MTRSTLCDYSGTYMHVKGTMKVANTGTAAARNNRNKKVIFKNCASFTNCIHEIINRKVDDALYIDVVMPMYNLEEYGDAYNRTNRKQWEKRC